MKNIPKEDEREFIFRYAIHGNKRIKAKNENEAKQFFWRWYESQVELIMGLNIELLKNLQWKYDKEAILFDIFDSLEE